MFEQICRENGITQRLTKPRSPPLTGQSMVISSGLRLDVIGKLKQCLVLLFPACRVDRGGSFCGY